MSFLTRRMNRRRAGCPASSPRWATSLIQAVLVGTAILAPDSILAGPDAALAANLPPETMITAGPPDSTTRTLYRVHFNWIGSDADGVVDHFDFIMVDHPRSKDSIGPGGNDPIVITVPAVDDPRWMSTSVYDSTFVTLADTLRRDPRPLPGETPADVLAQPFERWHTFFIRAVDDSGAVDPTPDFRSFNAYNYAPTAAILPPVLPGFEFTAPPTVVFNWDGNDPVGDFATRDPVASRYVIIDSQLDVASGWKSYPDSLYDLPERFHWSEWQPWPEGQQAIIKNLLRVGEFPGSGYYIFAVQTMDEAGAITPVFDYVAHGTNNVALIRVSGMEGPTLTVREPVLGMQTFIGDAQPISLDIVAGQVLEFRWSADASRYGGTITDYRYGWDIVDPDNDQEWSDWSLANTSVPPWSFSSGTHRLFVQTRDNAGSTSGAIYELQVFQPTWSRDILWVDDTDFLTDTVAEGIEDARWKSVLGFIDNISLLSFDENLDVYDIQEHPNELPDLALLLDYRVVVWSCRNGSTGTSGLRRAAQFVDPIPQRNWNTGRTFNILNVYIANGGRLWINGFRPAKQLWPDERAFGAPNDPVNVTNWDDPFEPHPPGVDSVGTTSLLYRMGIEMFDVGAVANPPRTTVQHYCYGLRNAAALVPSLTLAPSWAQGGTNGRLNIEIYNMPLALVYQNPPLVPLSGKSRVLYTYVSQVPEDPSQGVFYPLTADNQPLLVVTKNKVEDSYNAMAFCGFEPFLLEAPSHDALARYVLLESMGLEPTPVFLQQFAAVYDQGSVRLHWELAANSDPAEFELRATSAGLEWSVPFTAVGDRIFDAVDTSPHLAGAGSVTYSLFAREAGQGWVLLGQETVAMTAPPPRLQLLPPQPNPFNPRVTLAFVLPARQHVRLDILSVEGQRIRTLVDATCPAGPSSVVWDGADAAGRSVPSGLYLAHLESGGIRVSRKLVLMK